MNRKQTVELTNLCIVYDGKGNVLIEENVGRDYCGLIFPSNHVEVGESFNDSVIREIKEEIGLIISNLEFCVVKYWVEFDGSKYVVFFI